MTHRRKTRRANLDDLRHESTRAGGVNGEQEDGQQEEEGQRRYTQNKVVPHS